MILKILFIWKLKEGQDLESYANEKDLKELSCFLNNVHLYQVSKVFFFKSSLNEVIPPSLR